MARTRAWRRHKNYTKAKRKYDINRSWGGWWFDHPWYSSLHEYSKNKIHCSCPMCRRKTKNHGAAALFNGAYNPSLHDRRKDESMKQDLEEWKGNEEETEN